jgi:hypothetical protein
MHRLWTTSTSSTHTDIHTPLSAVESPSGPNVELFAPLPRLPCAPWQRKISHSPDPTDPKVGGVPQSQHFFQPHFLNHAKLAAMSDTFKIGVMCFASIGRKHITPFVCRVVGAPPISFLSTANCRSQAPTGPGRSRAPIPATLRLSATNPGRLFRVSENSRAASPGRRHSARTPRLCLILSLSSP